MHIDKYNHEHYHDPTLYAALCNIEQQKNYRPLVYICSPYSGSVKRNCINARRYCRFAVDKGYIPVAPHLFLPQFMSDETERETAMLINMVFLSKCREIWVFGSNITDGMKQEIREAEFRNTHIRYFTDEIKEVQE